MGNVDILKNHNEDERHDYVHIFQLVKRALQEANLLQLTVIEEQTDKLIVEPKPLSTEDKVKAFESLAGSAVLAGENVKELLKMANREEEWRNNELE